MLLCFMNFQQVSEQRSQFVNAVLIPVGSLTFFKTGKLL